MIAWLCATMRGGVAVICTVHAASWFAARKMAAMALRADPADIAVRWG